MPPWKAACSTTPQPLHHQPRQCHTRYIWQPLWFCGHLPQAIPQYFQSYLSNEFKTGNYHVWGGIQSLSACKFVPENTFADLKTSHENSALASLREIFVRFTHIIYINLRKRSLLQALVYYLTLPFIYLISLLPFPVMYLFSDFVYFVLFTCIGYRKEVVLKNLRNAFPEKTDEEINTICRGFYHHLCDITLETLKMLTISKKSILKHCRFSPEAFALYNKYAVEGRSIIMVLGHLGNWEMAGHPFSILCKQRLDVLYHPLTNKYFDRLMFRMRSRFGTKMVPMKTAFREMVAHKNDLTCTVFLADQTALPEIAYSDHFPEPGHTRTQRHRTNSPENELPGDLRLHERVKRGYYEMYSETLVENPASTAEGEITELHTRRLEKDIIADPAIWLWSHKRWKYSRKS